MIFKPLRSALHYVALVLGFAKTDPLMRDTIIYPTCLHESGHALELKHTAQFDDIMYSFEYGGDITEYFRRYRRKLAKREDIRLHPGLSGADRAHLMERIAKPAPR